MEILTGCLTAEDWLDGEPPSREFLLTRGDLQFLPRGTTNLFVGAGGASKTTLACQLAVAVATGQPWLGEFDVNRRGAVLLVAAEESRLDLRRRMYFAAKRAANNEDGYVLLNEELFALPGSGADVRLVQTLNELKLSLAPDVLAARLRDGSLVGFTPWAETLADELYRTGFDFGLIIFDPATRFGGSDFEIDSGAATRLVQALEFFTQLPGAPAVLLVHHSNKGSRTGTTTAMAARGSSALSDGVRSQMNLEAVPDPDNGDLDHPAFVRLRFTKANYTTRPRRPVLLRRGDEGILRMATAEEIAEIEGPPPTKPPTPRPPRRPPARDQVKAPSKKPLPNNVIEIPK